MAWSETRCSPHPLHHHCLQLCADPKGLRTARPQKGLEHCTLNTETQKGQSWAGCTGWLQCLRDYDEPLPFQGTQVPSQRTPAPPPSSSCSSTENPRALSPPQGCGHPRASRFLFPQAPPWKYPGSSLKLWLLPPEPPADISPYGVGTHGPHQSAGSPTSIPETGWMGAVSRLTAQENCIYWLRVRLLDMYENEVVKFLASPNPVLQWTERGCRQVGPDS